MEENSNRAEALRLLGMAEKLLQNRDLNASRDFAVLAQETEPLLEGSDQIVAVVDVLLAAENRINNHHDWYAILQIDRRSDDHDLIKKQYRRLALLLHPDKNKFAFADQAFKLVADAWAVLSNSSKKILYDKELTLFSKVDLSSSNSKLPVRRGEKLNQTRNVKKSADANNSNSSSGDLRSRLSTFWTACPYCYRLFEYPRVYEGCCLKCQNCNRAFQAVLIQNLPPIVPGKDAYYCCWSFFPLGFVMGNLDGDGKAPARAAAGFPNWMPPIFPSGQQQQEGGKNPGGGATAAPAPAATTASRGAEKRQNVVPPVNVSRGNATNSAPRKRGRPRKNPL